MKKIRGFKDHGCTQEQKIAYNYLFYKAHISGMEKENVIKSIDDNKDLKTKKLDTEAIKTIIENHYDEYIKKPFIANSYIEIAEKLTI